MERVAFLIESTGQRVECLLNPESFTLTRQAGLRAQRSLGAVLSGMAESDNLLLATGGGVTELVLELLFDVSKQSSAAPGAALETSVQALTAPLWALAENSERSPLGASTPPRVRFVWGKSWNIPARVVTVAERFEHFTAAGTAQRSWIKLRLVRCNEAAPSNAQAVLSPPRAATPFMIEQVPLEDLQSHEVQGAAPQDPASSGLAERIDQLAHRYYGNAAYWPLLAAFNGLDNPAELPLGTRLLVPPLSVSA
jgi:hypothetical protein